MQVMRLMAMSPLRSLGALPLEKGCRLPQIARGESFGEASVETADDTSGLVRPPLGALQPAQAQRRAERERELALPLGLIDRFPESTLGARVVGGGRGQQ